MTDRADQIRSLLAESPDDVFLNYSLGMELASVGDADAALASFARCEELDPAYLPAKIEAGKVLRSVGRLPEARAAFIRAEQAAQTAGDHHAADFVKAQLESLG